MLELIQQEDWHGLTVYVAVRVAIVLICWVFLAMATFIDMYYGRKAAKAAGEGLRSRKYRRTFNKIGDYIRVMVFALMFDFLVGLFTWYVAPFATVVYTISAVLIEFISVREKLQKIKDEKRKDNVINFEELGVDRIFVDEAHYYKNRVKRCRIRQD